MIDIQLGLIGDNIAQSKSPLMHRLIGLQNGVTIAYDRLIPKDLGQDFDAVFAGCAKGGFRGLNITYPYKEVVIHKVVVEDPHVRGIGAVNTVVFGPDGPAGFNTDYTGFVAAYRASMGQGAPGVTCMIGTGGVGRAVAFGLVALGGLRLHLVDRDIAKAQGLAADLATWAPEVEVSFSADAVSAAKGAQGLINCTPVGMVGYGGTPLPRAAMVGAEWAFDAVYTPSDTQFLQEAAAEGLKIISGYELFFHQGVHASKIFAGLPVDEPALRAALLRGE
ncbi:MAG: shikimate dehydrogenase [Rhodobacteraceae bacterium]|nr:shikimate dehydrogenase [Paracoccaceae bacterium]MCF8513575.1 shikimate dehydrogenase [Paracoccaceae bacterium]MCF8517525.1 shikimate dehydrogenase [Paracoccaceae bacterium]